MKQVNQKMRNVSLGRPYVTNSILNTIDLALISKAVDIVARVPPTQSGGQAVHSRSHSIRNSSSIIMTHGMS